MTGENAAQADPSQLSDAPAGRPCHDEQAHDNNSKRLWEADAPVGRQPSLERAEHGERETDMVVPTIGIQLWNAPIALRATRKTCWTRNVDVWKEGSSGEHSRGLRRTAAAQYWACMTTASVRELTRRTRSKTGFATPVRYLDLWLVQTPYWTTRRHHPHWEYSADAYAVVTESTIVKDDYVRRLLGELRLTVDDLRWDTS
ncbi:hypothetical protein POSPLADRAFT_1034110 [Postia placenta MAD-698-R-SB12]|uniref:Uncharacterized protein n=1 Tax=Postia placenta MAD-698-R-SB12 TaxID=670580 RepID=A0A1X6MYL7_9APHY|nr:hypothetical protein POSPLADRAFT_1034110 [Postia placenta MAD-698-R-SB12]OSX61455.1 hypothetical protein POSPLADRAFT_1034110 [Postia placenta MAD-698-R-SB12]